MEPTENNITYSQALAELEAIVKKMQSPDSAIASVGNLLSPSLHLL